MARYRTLGLCLCNKPENSALSLAGVYRPWTWTGLNNEDTHCALNFLMACIIFVLRKENSPVHLYIKLRQNTITGQKQAFTIFLLRPLQGSCSRNTNAAVSSACSGSSPPLPSLFWPADNGLPPSGTRLEASGTSRSTFGSLFISQYAERESCCFCVLGF